VGLEEWRVTVGPRWAAGGPYAIGMPSAGPPRPANRLAAETRNGRARPFERNPASWATSPYSGSGGMPAGGPCVWVWVCTWTWVWVCTWAGAAQVTHGVGGATAM
jgi:hypothetical protein